MPDTTQNFEIEETSDAIRKLRELGVTKSVVCKDDLDPDRKSIPKPIDPSMFHPRAVIPSEITSTSDYSLMIQTQAMKYLNDEALTHLAKISPHQKNERQVNFEPANLTQYGLPEGNVSLATRDFLNHRLFNE